MQARATAPIITSANVQRPIVTMIPTWNTMTSVSARRRRRSVPRRMMRPTLSSSAMGAALPGVGPYLLTIALVLFAVVVDVATWSGWLLTSGGWDRSWGADHPDHPWVRAFGQPLASLRAQAEAQAALGDLAGAVDRLRAGQRLSRSSGAVESMEGVVIESRLKALEQQRRAELERERRGEDD